MKEKIDDYPKIGVVVIARNEAENIHDTLNALFKQTIPLSQIILVDDNSIDDTLKIAKNFDVKILTFPEIHDNWITRPELAKIFNYGLEQLDVDNLDFISIVGADHILSHDYFEQVTGRMTLDDSVVASGAIQGEIATAPRGSGRVIRKEYWKKIGSELPVNFGYETYVYVKAMQLGFNVSYYDDIITKTSRQTAITYKPIMYYHYGYAMRALGYPFLHTFLRAVLLLKRGKGLKSFRLFLKGYFSNKDTFYEESLRNFISKRYNTRRVLSNPTGKIKRFMDTKY
ncbi:MAG: glycosyltransferase family 2 protein [Nitrosopumilus sp.]|nr:glycosyltransferase family 2 protein [Nitrosopumilus sp.]MDH3736500.1 glycosyltransferase family 2 protein [Nitrosopumilus sp.]MDH3822756.1 glycosyltransferase family 2 protein [Nitrosopumilus sp.]MDH3834482.1 glycosyltransferase family 2 protein [Nitrosopumilus sp.]